MEVWYACLQNECGVFRCDDERVTPVTDIAKTLEEECFGVVTEPKKTFGKKSTLARVPSNDGDGWQTQRGKKGKKKWKKTKATKFNEHRSALMLLYRKNRAVGELAA